MTRRSPTASAGSRRGPRTLRGRLSLAALACAASVMVLLTVVCNVVVRHHLQQQADDELHTRVAAVAATVDTRHTPVRVLETSDDAPLDTNVWIYAGPRLLEHPASAPAGAPLSRAAVRLAAHGDKRCAALDAGAPIRLCAAPVGHTGATGRPAAAVVAALDLAPYRTSAATLLWASLALDGAVLAGAYVLTWLAVGRALRPVTVMTDQATRRSAVASPHRLAGTGRPAELARLGASLDELLDRIRAVLRHEQQLTRELSHELRTPLARITAELDWWRARPRSAAETSATHAVLADAADSMRSICDTLLDDARATARAAPGTADAVATLRRLADRLTLPDGPAVTVTGPDAAVAGVPAPLLERIVGPLADNALRYARTQVGIRVGRADGVTRVEVGDDGPGVPPAFVAELFRPGSRADPEDGHGGAGLGLALARRLARAAGGEVAHDAGCPSGARFVVTLPGG
ncbi:sensor histidine kinase [Streptomyces benahoarensis]|uniref:Signal transduction histidine-protein kinase/phosphatase MprB n=1 Tax=Streptomyces benahoarensis TaxID=2595054 RepID=A0A553Z6C6_9ACTN|nr:HAMP domain-containing sensor histidine kinase [Streptomyces benahoarensis]TSB31446.1 HAMP domain-containing histidine kinase [Streptomyces benahoarensis]TSB36984.1 HAMP domain-containing histidine kinase [Streptomyces benahoarensis]